MVSICFSNTLYKGVFAIITGLVLLEYLYGSISGSTNYVYNVTRLYLSTTENEAHNSSQTGRIKAIRLFLLQNETRKISGARNLENGTSQTHIAALLNNVNSTSVFDGKKFELGNASVPLCPETPPHLVGRIPVIKEPVPNPEDLESRFTWLEPGGHWSPKTCHAIDKVAIIIPYRARGHHLLLFLQHMHPLLKKQQLDYTIFIVEQEGTGPFNRAMMMNIGFTEALKHRDFDCFIFHDIDLLPENDRNIYNCPEQPRHMSVSVSTLYYRLPYSDIFGGVCAISTKHFEMLNGFSNSFWGWGGEDDDMANRIKYHHLHVSRYPANIARYYMLKHERMRPNKDRFKVLYKGMTKFNKDGLNNLRYKLVERKHLLLYTWILAGTDDSSLYN